MSEFNEKLKPIDNKKLIKCKNCRQEIEEEKMFLHEGFCQRNNIFCEHCQKVFLKKDYNKHLKLSTKKSMRYLKTPERPRRREKEAKIQQINIYTSPIITKRKTTFEYIEMPMTEQYKVNNPIIISENGQILSNENKNEYLLPYFGINSPNNNNERNNILMDDLLINQDDILNETNQILFNDNDMNVNQYIDASLKNSLRLNNINNDYNMMNEINKVEINNNELNPKLNIIELTENNPFLNNKNSLNRSHSSRILLNNINLDKDNMEKQNNNFNEHFIHNKSDTKKIKLENEQKNNNIIINNNIITYNANNNINKIHNFYNTEKTSPNNKDKSLMNNDIFQDINSTKFNSTRVSKKNEIIKFKKNLEIKIVDNALRKSSKEPNDSDDKRLPRNSKVTSYLVERSPQNTKHQKKIPQTEKKIKKTKNKCEFCGTETDDLVYHYKIYHYKMNKVIKPKKRDTEILNEKLSSSNMDETGIEESNKRILSRQLKPTFNLMPSDNLKNYQTTAKKKTKQHKFISPKNVKKINKINFNNMNSNQKTEKKESPEDNLRGSLIAKTQQREYDRKKIIYIGDNFRESESKLNKREINLNTESNNNFFSGNKNGIIKPIYLFTEGKKDEYYKKKKIIRSPLVKKINFLETILDDDIDNY